MSTHTPGPWYCGQYGNSFIVTAKDQMYDVAVVRNIGREDNEANARLIAAAPEMLNALQFLLNVQGADELSNVALEMKADEGDAYYAAVLCARAAIAKATGEQA